MLIKKTRIKIELSILEISGPKLGNFDGVLGFFTTKHHVRWAITTLVWSIPGRRYGDGTLERVVKYDKEAFTKAWDHLASSSSDGEDGQRFFFFFPTPFLGRLLLFFFPAVHACRVVGAKRKRKGFNPKNTRRFQKRYRLRHG